MIDVVKETKGYVTLKFYQNDKIINTISDNNKILSSAKTMMSSAILHQEYQIKYIKLYYRDSISSNVTKQMTVNIKETNLIDGNGLNSDLEEVYTYEPVEIVDMNGVLYPTKDKNFYEVDYDIFANMSIQLRDSYKIDYILIEVISEYQKLHALYTNGEYTYAVSEAGNTGYVPNVLITELPSNYIEVDLSDQKVSIINNNEIIIQELKKKI